MTTRRSFLGWLGAGAAVAPAVAVAAASKAEAKVEAMPLPTIQPVEGDIKPCLRDYVIPANVTGITDGCHTHSLTSAPIGCHQHSFTTGPSFSVRPVYYKIYRNGEWVEL